MESKRSEQDDRCQPTAMLEAKMKRALVLVEVIAIVTFATSSTVTWPVVEGCL